MAYHQDDKLTLVEPFLTLGRELRCAPFPPVKDTLGLNIMQNITIRNMALADYERVIQLWKSCDGVHMHRDYSETYEGMENFLIRNSGMSFIALDGKNIVGAVLGSHDGRRGFINHLAVMKAYRKKGIARQLVENVIRALKGEGMLKIAIFILKNNADTQAFWQRIGFSHEDIVDVHSIVV